MRQRLKTANLDARDLRPIGLREAVFLTLAKGRITSTFQDAAKLFTPEQQFQFMDHAKGNKIFCRDQECAVLLELSMEKTFEVINGFPNGPTV